MKHYDIAEWADFARGVAAPAAAASMRRHLDEGCEACAATARRLDLVSRVAEADRAYEPPAHLVRFAQAAFSLRRPERVLSLPALAARLVFNSLDAALAAGVRGPVEEISRQTLYEAGDFAVHLRFEQPSGASRVSLTGQIANRRVPNPPMAHVRVLLTRGRTVVARSLSNEFGEFQVDYEPHAALRLHIPVSDGRQSIQLALNDVQGEVVGDPQPPAAPRRGPGRPAGSAR